MKAILYMIRKTVKNWFFDMIRHPAKLVGGLILVLLIGYSIFNMLFSQSYAENISEISEGSVDVGILHGVYFVLLFFVGGIVIARGLKSGTTFFTMGDVNMMFCSPLSSKILLVYGLIRQMLTMLLMAIIFLVYGGMAKNLFGITVGQAVVLVASFFLFMAVVQIVALFLYSTTNGKPQFIRTAKIVLVLLIAVPVAIIIVQLVQQGFTLPVLYEALKSPAAELVPIFGWMKGLTMGLISGNLAAAAVYGELMALVVAVSLVFFLKSSCDYYEDVLQNTETTYEMRQAVKKKGMNGSVEAYMKMRKIKVRSTGIKAGKGASTFMFKHILERSRFGYLLFWDMYSVITIAVSCVVAFFFVNTGGDDAMSPEASMLILLGMASYMQMFFSVTGDWARELSKPYIYLVPDSPFKKLMFATMTSIIKPFLDGVLLFVIAGFILGVTPLAAVVSVVVYTSFSCLYCGINIITDRVLGFLNNQALSMFLYIIICAVSVIPGIILSVLLGIAFSGMPIWLAPIGAVLWNLLLSLVFALISKNTLHNMELPF